MEPGDRRLVEIARQREVDRVVGGRRRDLPALRVEEPLAGRVPVDLEREVDPVEQALQRLRLLLGDRRRPAVGLAREDRRRALLVVVEVVRVVAVRVDAVGDRRHPVAVVVAQVLAPQPLGVERVLVAVGVRDQHEPQLGLLQQVLDGLVVGAPALDVPAHQAPVDLGRDPLARVLRGAEQHRRAPAVRLAARSLRELDREDLAALERRAESHELGELRVVARDRVHLIADASRLVPRAPHVEAVLRLGERELLDRHAALDARLLRGDPVGGEPRALRVVEDELDREPARGPALDGEVDALAAQLLELSTADDGRVDLKPQAVTPRCCRAGSANADEDRRGRGSEAPTSHDPLPSWIKPLD